jgi:dimeric dUTPase (all-alpha-NTP-PPase superfamily)
MKQNNLKKLFDVQKKFQKRLYDLDGLTEDEKIKITKEFVLSAHKELSEILDCFNWKSHRKEDNRFVVSNLGEEVVDTIKYVLNICLIWGIDYKEFEKFFDEKSAVVEQRRNQEFMKQTPGQKVCALDLDDVLCYWEIPYVIYYNKVHGTNYRCYSDIVAKENTIKRLNTKHEWRTSGLKRNLPVVPGASAFTKKLKKLGYRIVIITSRPYKEYSRLFGDTIFWLKKNKIAYDDIYFDDQKHLTILKKFPKLDFMVDDNPKFQAEVSREGYTVYSNINEASQTIWGIRSSKDE